MLKKNLLSIALVTAAMSLAACSDKEAVTEPVYPAATTDVAVDPQSTPDMPAEAVAESTDAMPVDAAATQSIGEMAAGNETLPILAEALQAAELDDMMMAEGQSTAFAPRDA